MKTKSYRILLFSIIMLVIILTFAGVMIFLKERPALPGTSVSENEFMYLVKEYNHKVGVFKYGQTSPVLTLDVYVDTLPKKDQTTLETGIKVYDSTQLERLIEDLES
ncbi:MAG: hypothetical protein RR497_05610 [Oscillospiraceae bacterium]